ncbi:helix-turn-helix transcriptional regulator [Lysinibacillus sp. FSL L8-0126]|uniref:helix-turn-helix domain-containing protein n=1 Tax=Lysinibacillus sp. FSL L8-0126 TaxID=2921515 RepID=UPI00315A0069
MTVEWKLRHIMAKNEIWTGTELARLMEEKTGYKMSAPSISALINEMPKQMKVTTLDALCSTLNCKPNDLLVHSPSTIMEKNIKEKKEVLKVANGERSLPPI